MVARTTRKRGRIGGSAPHGRPRPLHPALHAVAWVVLLSVTLGAGAALHLDHPLSRRLIAASVNRILASVFVGRVVVDRIRGLRLSHLDGVDAHVDDARGRTLLRIEGADARVSAWTLVRSFVTRQQDIVVDVPKLSVVNLEVDLDAEADGSPRLVTALSPREPAPRSASGPSVHLRLTRVVVDRMSFRVEPSAPVEGEVTDLEGSVRVESGVTGIDVNRGRITARALPSGPLVRVDVEGHLTAPALRMRAVLQGAVGGVGERADVKYDEGALDAVLEVPLTAPEVLRAVWPSSPIVDASSLHAELHGVLPRLDAVVRAGLGPATVSVRGPLQWTGSEAHGDLVVQADQLDVRTFAPSVPHSSVAASADVSLTAKPAGDLSASATIDFAGGRWGAVRMPAAAIRADVALPAGGLPTANAAVEVREPGAPATIVGHLAPRGGSLELSFTCNATVPRLDDVTRIRGLIQGSMAASAAGSIDFGTKTLAVQVSATGETLQLGETTVADAQINSRVSGDLESPSFDLDVVGDALRSGSLTVSTFRAAGRAAGRVSGSPEILVRNLDLQATGAGSTVHAHASVLGLGADRMRADDVQIEGLGALVSGRVQASSEGVLVQTKTSALDLAALASFVHVPVTRGTLSLDVDATVGARSADGRVSLEVANAALYGIRDANARVEASVHGRRVSGRADVRVEDIATLAVRSSSIDIGPGRLVTAAPWRRTWGAVDFDTHVDLARLVARLPLDRATIGRLGGEVEVEGRVARDSIEDATPGVDVRIRTKDLELAGAAPGSWHVEGVTPTLHVTVDGDTGATLVQAELDDVQGPLFDLKATSNAVPYAVLFSDQNPAAALRAMPFDATVEIPSRELGPPFTALGVGSIAGRIGAKVHWQGSAMSPSVDLAARITGARFDPALMTSHVDLAIDGHYDGAHAAATLRALARDAEVLRATGAADVRAADVLASFGGVPLDWSASARASLHKMPLRLLSPLYDRQIRGTASGEIVLEGLHRDAQASATLTVDGLQVGDVTCRTATARIGIGGGVFDGEARIDHIDGFVEGRAHFGTRWGAAPAPSFDPSTRAQVSLSAKRFRAAILSPFLVGTFAELDGRIDASAHAELDPGVSGAMALHPQGSLELSGGTFELMSFGTEFRDAAFKLTLAPDGVVRLENATAHGLSGTVRAAATAQFDAAGLAAARASVRMPAKDPLPLVFDGVQLGQLDGQFDLSLERTGHEVDIAVDVPTAHVRLPSGLPSADVQALGDVEDVEIGVRRGPDRFTSVSLDAAHDAPPESKAGRKAQTKVGVRLGHDVHVSRGTNLDVRLEGQPTITFAGATTVAGQIRMPSGSIDVQGKPFEIENGTVTFVGSDPANPQVVLTAGWTASDGTRVYADFIGPLKTAQVRLRSSPARSQNEILALILYGTSDAAAVTTTSAATSTQSAPFAGVAAQPLNQALGGVNRLMQNLGMAGGITTKIDTSQIVARPEVEVQISRDISLQVAWVLGAPPPGTNPDTALVTLDWRFLRKWSLETTVGDAGTSILNLVWQQRY